MKAKYGKKVKVYDPGHLGAVLISSETDEFTIKDMIKEFEIGCDEYLRGRWHAIIILIIWNMAGKASQVWDTERRLVKENNEC